MAEDGVDRLHAVQRVATSEHEKLREKYPEIARLGGTLLLGKHYADADRGLLMLGLNPGGNDDERLYLDRYKVNCLLPGSPNPGYRYWRNARTLFSATEQLLNEMELATFSFCCPFRTPTWSKLPRPELAALIEHSRPILRMMLKDCMPRLVIAAGVASLDALTSIASPDLQIGALLDDGGAPHGTYQWRSYGASLDGSQLVVAQIPHPSRANSRERLLACGKWLSELVLTTA